LPQLQPDLEEFGVDVAFLTTTSACGGLQQMFPELNSVLSSAREGYTTRLLWSKRESVLASLWRTSDLVRTSGPQIHIKPVIFCVRLRDKDVGGQPQGQWRRTSGKMHWLQARDVRERARTMLWASHLADCLWFSQETDAVHSLCLLIPLPKLPHHLSLI